MIELGYCSVINLVTLFICLLWIVYQQHKRIVEMLISNAKCLKLVEQLKQCINTGNKEN